MVEDGNLSQQLFLKINNKKQKKLKIIKRKNDENSWKILKQKVCGKYH